MSENEPKEVKPQDLGAAPGVHFVHAACGRNDTLLFGSCGTVGGWGEYSGTGTRLYLYFFDFVVLSWPE
jgi:hypothetical protein